MNRYTKTIYMTVPVKLWVSEINLHVDKYYSYTVTVCDISFSSNKRYKSAEEAKTAAEERARELVQQSGTDWISDCVYPYSRPKPKRDSKGRFCK